MVTKFVMRCYKSCKKMSSNKRYDADCRFSLNLARPHLIQRLMSVEKTSLKLFWFSWLCWWSETLKLCSVVKSDIKGIEICCYDNIKASQTGLHLYHLQVGFKSIMTFEMLLVGTDSRKKVITFYKTTFCSLDRK